MKVVRSITFLYLVLVIFHVKKVSTHQEQNEIKVSIKLFDK